MFIQEIFITKWLRTGLVIGTVGISMAVRSEAIVIEALVNTRRIARSQDKHSVQNKHV